MAAARATARSKPKREKGKPRPDPRIPGWGRIVEVLSRMPAGAWLFAIGTALGFAIGLFMANLPPAVMPEGNQENAPVPTPNVATAPEMKQPATPVPTAAPAEPASAEEGTHQSATVSVLPPDQPESDQAVPDTAAAGQAVTSDAQPLWLKNAVASRAQGDQPMICIVIDDVGISPQHAQMALALPGPVVISIMTYAANAAALARQARSRGHEVLVHMPMQPVDGRIDAGPNSLDVGLDAGEITRRVDWGLRRLSGYVGFNNHMGSRFTQDEAGMRVVLAEAKSRGLLFLDSRTIAGSIADRLAAEMGVVHIVRDVFLDDDMSEAAVARQLAATEAIARRQGFAVAIGHPHPATIAALMRWLPEAGKRGFAIVPLTAIVKKREGVAG